MTKTATDDMPDPRVTMAYFKGGAPAWLGGVHARPAGAAELRPGESAEVTGIPSEPSHPNMIDADDAETASADDDAVVIDDPELEVTVRMRPLRRMLPSKQRLHAISQAIAAQRRAPNVPGLALTDLADLVEELLRTERAMAASERTSGRVTYEQIEDRDAVQIALARAVRR